MTTPPVTPPAPAAATAPMLSSAEALRTRLTESLANLAMPGVKTRGLGPQIGLRLSDPALRQGVLVSISVDRLAHEQERALELWVLDLAGGSATLSYLRPASRWELDMVPDDASTVSLHSMPAQQRDASAALALHPLAPASLEPVEPAHAG